MKLFPFVCGGFLLLFWGREGCLFFFFKSAILLALMEHRQETATCYQAIKTALASIAQDIKQVIM